MTWRGDSVFHQDVFCVFPGNQRNKWDEAERCCENHKWREKLRKDSGADVKYQYPTSTIQICR